MKKIKFETGTIDPRQGHFDHHGDIIHSNAFISKMASVQLIEYLIIKNEIDTFSIEQVELNHVGHLDDIVMHAIEEARDNNKIRSLYAFACKVSSLDSLGPCAYGLFIDKDRDIINQVYGRYQKLLSNTAKEQGIKNFEVGLEYKIEYSIEAGKLLVSLLDEDIYTAHTPWVPPIEDYSIKTKENDIWLIEVRSGMNPLRASGYFYSNGCKVMIAYTYMEKEKVWVYSIAARSPYDVDLSNLWYELSLREENGKWGGHAGAGGSPRQSHSKIEPHDVYIVVKDII